MNSYYTMHELLDMDFKYLGKNVLISKKCSLYGTKNMSIGDNTRIDDFTILSGNLCIGKYVHIAAYTCLFGSTAGIDVFDFAGFSAHCSVYAASDDYSGASLTNPTIPGKYRNVIEAKVVIKKHSIIGSGSVILPGVILEEGTSIGSMSLVTKSTKPWTIYVGTPIRELKERKKDLLTMEERLLNEENY